MATPHLRLALALLVACALSLPLPSRGYGGGSCVTCWWCTREDSYWNADGGWWNVLAIQCPQPKDPADTARFYYNLTLVRKIDFELYNEARVPLSFAISSSRIGFAPMVRLASNTSCLRLKNHVPLRYVPAGGAYGYLDMKSDAALPYSKMSLAHSVELDCTKVYKYVWAGSSWTPSCAEGGGVQTRTVSGCVNTVTGDNVGQNYCEEYAEAGTRTCSMAWKTGKWNTCGSNPYGACSSVRNATCTYDDGTPVSEADCLRASRRPALVDFMECFYNNDTCAMPSMLCECSCPDEERAQSGTQLLVVDAAQCSLDVCRGAVCAHATAARISTASDGESHYGAGIHTSPALVVSVLAAAAHVARRLRASDEWNAGGAGLAGWPLLHRVPEATEILRQLICNWDLGALNALPYYRLPTLGQLQGTGKTTMGCSLLETLRTPAFQVAKRELLFPGPTGQQLYETYASKIDDFIQNGIVVHVSRAVTWDDLLTSLRAAIPVQLKSTRLSVLLQEAIAAIARPVLFFFDDLPCDEDLLDRLYCCIAGVYTGIHYLGAAQPFFGFLAAGRELGPLHLPVNTPARLEWIQLPPFSLGDVRLVVAGLAGGAFAHAGQLVTAETLEEFSSRLHEASGGIALLMFQVALGVNYSFEHEVSKNSAPDLDVLFDICFEALSSIGGTDSFFEFPTLQEEPGLSAVLDLAATQRKFLLDEMVGRTSIRVAATYCGSPRTLLEMPGDSAMQTVVEQVAVEMGLGRRPLYATELGVTRVSLALRDTDGITTASLASAPTAAALAELRGSLEAVDRAGLADPGNNLVFADQGRVHWYVGARKAREAVRRWLQSPCGSQTNTALLVDGSAKSGKTTAARFVVPFLIREAQDWLCGASDVKYVDLAVCVLHKTDTVDQRFAAVLTRRSSQAHCIIVFDGHQALFSGLDEDEEATMATLMKDLLVGRRTSCGYIIAGSTQPLVWKALSLSGPNGSSLVFEETTLTTDFVSSDIALDNEQETTDKASEPPRSKSFGNAAEPPQQMPAAPEAPLPDAKQRRQPRGEKGRRVDIQAMRALAVAVVVLFHLDAPWMRGGFVGVDIFFVISGFLVFGSVVHELVKNEFSLLEFFARRAKRLNPPSALMLVLLVAVLWRSAYCMYHEKCAEQMHDILMASLLCANIGQMTKSEGYFETSSPSIVLHYWSLAVEEQLYAVGPVMAVSAAASFGAMLAETQRWRFYFVGSRYWEFALGALVSHYDECLHSKRLGCLRPAMSKWHWIAAYCAAAGYPNALALPVCLMTALLIACKAQIRRAPVVEAIGDMSYSIYLYHFPVVLLVAFYEGISMSEKPAWVVTLVLIGAFSSTSYHLVEKPLQRKTLPWTTVVVQVFTAKPMPLRDGNASLVPWMEDGNPHNGPVLRVNSYGAVNWYQDPGWAPLDLPPIPAARLFHRTPRAALAVNGDSHVVHLWKLLFNYGAELNATYWSGGFTHSPRNRDHFELMWNPPPFWAEDNYAFRASLLSFRNRFRDLPRWGEDFKRYAREWIGRSSCTAVLVDSPVWADAENRELPVREWPLTCLRTRRASSCAYGQEARLKFHDVGWVRDIVRASPELAARVEMVSLNDLACWDGVCHSHVYDVPVFYDSAHYTVQFLDFARNYVVARLRSSSCFKRIEAAMGQAAHLDAVYGPMAQPQSIL
eukprot:m51a1_g8052 hypothetical protein (1671) ;mRNA; r:105990-117157